MSFLVPVARGPHHPRAGPPRPFFGSRLSRRGGLQGLLASWGPTPPRAAPRLFSETLSPCGSRSAPRPPGLPHPPHVSSLAPALRLEDSLRFESGGPGTTVLRRFAKKPPTAHAKAAALGPLYLGSRIPSVDPRLTPSCFAPAKPRWAPRP